MVALMSPEPRQVDRTDVAFGRYSFQLARALDWEAKTDENHAEAQKYYEISTYEANLSIAG